MHAFDKAARWAQVLARASDIREGCDDSGAITVLLDGEGTAREVAVAPDWRQRLPLTEVGAALVAADAQAATRRATAMARALAERSTAPESTVDVAGRPGWLVPAEEGVARSLAQLSAAVFAAVADLDRVTAPPPPVSGSGGGGAVRVSMTQGRLTGCVVEQAWLQCQDGTSLARALSEAVRAAAEADTAARLPLSQYQKRLRGLLADAAATITASRSGPA